MIWLIITYETKKGRMTYYKPVAAHEAAEIAAIYMAVHNCTVKIDFTA